MLQRLLNNIYSALSIPVIVCADTEDMPVVYMNIQAGLIFSPSYSVNKIYEDISPGKFTDIVHFSHEDDFPVIRQILSSIGHIDNYENEIITFEGITIPVYISGNSAVLEGNEYFIFYITEKVKINTNNVFDYTNQISSTINAALLSDNVDSAIHTVLSMAGRHINVSRVYIFEEISDTTTRNTYEWCADGVIPAIHDLQNLEKDDYNYDIIVNSGMYITDDVRLLPGNDREILEQQGIKALAIIPFYDISKPLGYVGYDDCINYRKWSHVEIQFLQTIANLLASLIKRRNAERESKHSQEILQIIMDNSDDIIYANDIEDYTVKFVNRALADSLGKDPSYFMGKKCWEVFQIGQTGPCSFCPTPKIEFEPGQERSKVYSWEYKNSINGKTYMIKDNIARWVDGKYVHIETGVDISHRKEYEEQLHFYASTDVMTGVYNREWGTKLLTDKLNSNSESGSLCFIDLDGLKHTNDHFGHDAGDEFLMETVKCIRKFLKDDEFICRWGGDEFILWLAGNPEEANQTIKNIQNDMSNFNRKFTKQFKLSFSYGIVPFKVGTGINLDNIITIADGAMYKNKIEKRNMNLKRRRSD